MPQYIGKEIGGYHVIEPIGAGGMAAVFKAYQASFDRFVALKILPEHFAQDQMYVDRFIREAKIIAKLEHKHILPVYDFGSDDEITYLSMRYLQAGTLKDLVARTENHKLPLGDTVRIVAQIAEALDCAHEQNIVHRDVKPSNILVDKLGDAYLMDFGIAKILDATSQLTQTGGTVGTPAYMSPEQAAGTEIDSRADIYALGIILFELMVGEVPFTANTPVAVILAHITTPPPIPSSLNPDIPPAIEKIILKALAKKPEERYRSAGEFANALKEAADKEPIEVSTDVLQMSSDLASDKSPEDVTLADRQLIKKMDRQAMIQKALPWTLGVGAIAIIITLAVLFFSAQSTATELAEATPDLTRAAEFIVEQTETQVALIQNETETQAALIVNQTATAEGQLTLEVFNAQASETAAALQTATVLQEQTVTAAVLGLTATPSPEWTETSTPTATPSPTATHTPTITPIPTPLGGGSGQIAFISERDGNRNIYMMDADGSNVQQLTDYIGVDDYPAWSPDGSQIAFVSHQAGKSDIYVMDADGSNLQQLTNNEGLNSNPTWSPDGSQIAFVSLRNDYREIDYYEIYVMNADGSNPRNLTNSGYWDDGPTWSPDGSQIAYHSLRNDGNEIYVMDSNGKNHQRLTDNTSDDQHPAWSPDGSQIAFVSNRDGGSWVIYVMSADGNNQLNLMMHVAWDWSPAWSPDGELISYVSIPPGQSSEDDRMEIYVMDADGSNVRRLTNSTVKDGNPVWRP